MGFYLRSDPKVCPEGEESHKKVKFLPLGRLLLPTSTRPDSADKCRNDESVLDTARVGSPNLWSCITEQIVQLKLGPYISIRQTSIDLF